jgi:threonyl-tRNA synthetase
MIHRAPFGSMERFIAILLEHTGGNFPLWLTPEQVKILPISEKYEKYAKNVLNLLDNSDIRATIDLRNEKVGRKIRDAEMMKVPYMIIIGEKEADNGTVSVRKHKEGDLGSFTIDEFVDLIRKDEQKDLKKFE